MWNEKVASTNDRVLSTPSFCAPRILINEVADIYNPETDTFNLRKFSNQYQAGDLLRVIPFEGDKLSTDGIDVKVLGHENFNYHLKNMPKRGKFLVVKQYNQDLVPNEEGDYGYKIVPITLNMLEADDGTLRSKGIVSPGWYKWRQLVSKDDPTKIVQTDAILLVAIKGFTNDDTAYEGQFDIEGIMQFDENGEMILG